MIYIIPAYEEKIKDKGYSELIKGAKKFDEVRFLNLQIKGNTLDKLYRKAVNFNDITEKDTIIGFSMGALIAYYISTFVVVKKLICNSLSPMLAGDLKKIPANYIKKLGLPVEEMNTMKYVSSLADETIFIIGKKEKELLKRRSKLLARKNKGRLIVADGDHELFVDRILEALSI